MIPTIFMFLNKRSEHHCETESTRTLIIACWHKAQLPHTYCIAGYFWGGKFLQIEPSQLFKGKIFTNCHKLCGEPTGKEHFEGKVFTNWTRFVKFAKIFPLKITRYTVYWNSSSAATCIICTFSTEGSAATQIILYIVYIHKTQLLIRLFCVSVCVWLSMIAYVCIHYALKYLRTSMYFKVLLSTTSTLSTLLGTQV